MIDHTGVVVSDFEASKRFYEQALGAIGLATVLEFPAAVTGHTDVAGFGPPGKAEFWISAATAGQTPNTPPLHVAFRVDTRAEVEAFYAAAMAAGGTDNGGPGLRAHYTRTTTAPLCAIRTATTSRRSAIHPLEARETGMKKGHPRVPFLLERVRLTWQARPSCWCPACG
jgi:catechol 2,3-dioxygenase-like lactoylglutathione lyase family enzyme